MIVAGIKENQNKMLRMLKFCEKQKIPNVDISVDLSKKEYNFLPIDAHPNALANREFADKLFRFIKENNFLNLSPTTPTPSANQQSQEGVH